jgi:cytochrome c-type biogenesis protein CcmF
VATLEPAANFYGGDTSGITTPAVLNTPKGDLYLTLRSLDSESAELGLDTSPMIWLIWLGGAVTAAGGFWALQARRSERIIAPKRPTADV